MRIISYGGGVQSTALVALTALGELPPVDAAVLANVGDDSEHPATLHYVREIAKPWAEQHGIKVLMLDRIKRDGTKETLYGRLTKPDKRSIPIPAYFSGGTPGGRACTADFKIKVVGKWLKNNGATKDNPAEVAIGISTDEIQRVNPNRAEPYEQLIYPLIDLGLSRGDCHKVIEDAGLPVPPKSSCYFCPYHRPTTWQHMRRYEPELFAKSVELERQINTKRKRNGATPVYLTRFNKPLDEAIVPEQDNLLDLIDPIDGECDSGRCWT